MTTTGNVQFVAPIMKNIKALDLSRLNVIGSEALVNTGQRDTYHIKTLEGSRQNAIPITSKRNTYTKNTTKISTDTTTAKKASPDKEEKQIEHKRTDIAVVAFSSEEKLIGDKLTKFQQQKVKQEVYSLRDQKYIAASDVEIAIKVVTACLLDKDYFPRIGSNFYHKLNAIHKQIIQGKFSYVDPEQLAKPSELKKLKNEIKLLGFEKDSLSQALKNFSDKSSVFKTITDQIAQLEAKKRDLEQKALINYDYKCKREIMQVDVRTKLKVKNPTDKLLLEKLNICELLLAKYCLEQSLDSLSGQRNFWQRELCNDIGEMQNQIDQAVERINADFGINLADENPYKSFILHKKRKSFKAIDSEKKFVKEVLINELIHEGQLSQIIRNYSIGAKL